MMRRLCTACRTLSVRTNAAVLNNRLSSTTAAPLKTVKSGIDFPKTVLHNRSWEMHQAGRNMTVYVDSGSIAWIVMDRADSSANALGVEFGTDLVKALDIVEQLVADNKAQAAILASAKATFCVGADIDQMYPLMDREIAKMVPAMGHEFFHRMESEKFPFVAAINGLALGGGFELSLACSHRLMASTAKVGFPECLLGLIPAAGGTVRTQRLCGLKNTVTWVLSSQQVNARKAKAAGACDEVIPAEDRWEGENRFYEGVRRWVVKNLVDKPLRRAKRKNITLLDRVLENTSFGRNKVASEAIKMLNKRTKGKYIGHYKALECIMYSATHSDKEGYAKECEAFSELLCSPEAKNQISLYFLDEGMKKSEQKTGVRKDSIPPVKSVGVIGAGVMGSGIAHHFLKKDIQVTVKDVMKTAVDAGIQRVRSEFDGQLKRKKMDQAAVDRKMALLSGGTANDVLRNVDVIVEAAVEIMDIKKKLVQELEADKVLDGKNLFATNTSSLSLTELQTVSKYPNNIVGMHFFNPVSKMPLVEVIKGKQTSDEAVAAIFQLALSTGKKPIIVKDGPGFLVNRILGVYMAEAGRLVVEEHCDPEKVDEAILNFGMPMGPFRLLDEVGLDVACHVGQVLHSGLKNDRFKVSDHMQQLVSEGYLGKKNGKGIYKYDNKGKEQGLNRAVFGQYMNLRGNSLSENEIIDRCILLMVNEATFILAEGIANSPEDVDIGMIWGAGFPPYRGGLLQYADHRGAQSIVDTLNRLQDKLKSDRFKPSDMLIAMGKNDQRFFPSRPYVPYRERKGYPQVRY